MKDVDERQAFIKRLTGRDLEGSRVAVLNALGTQGWDVVAAWVGIGGTEPESFPLKRLVR